MAQIVPITEVAEGARAAPLDWPRIEAWSAEVAAGGSESLGEVFRSKGGRGPEIYWSPAVERLAAPQLRFLLRYWQDLRGSRVMPLAREIDAIEMRPALGYISLLDVVDGGRDFHYRLFGSIVAGVSGFDMTGFRASQLRASPFIAEFAVAVFRAALKRSEPLLTQHGPPGSGYTFSWHRLVLPLADAGGGTQRFLVGTVPMARDGRPVSLRL